MCIFMCFHERICVSRDQKRALDLPEAGGRVLEIKPGSSIGHTCAHMGKSWLLTAQSSLQPRPHIYSFFHSDSSFPDHPVPRTPRILPTVDRAMSAFVKVPWFSNILCHHCSEHRVSRGAHFIHFCPMALSIPPLPFHPSICPSILLPLSPSPISGALGILAHA